MTEAERELFIENLALKSENGFLKNQNQALRERIFALEQIPEFEAIKNAAHGAGTPKSSSQKNRIVIITHNF